MSASATTQAPTPNKSRKPRSPAAPSYNLEVSLGDVRKLYDSYGRAAFSQAELASKLGISADSGPTAARVFTLKEYGLIAKDGDNYKVTDEFVALKTAEGGSNEFKRSAYAAVLRASLFNTLITAFGSKLPSQATVATRLEGQMKFNADRAKEIASILDSSMRFAGVVDGSGNIVPVRDDGPKPPKADEQDEEKSDNGNPSDPPRQNEPKLPGSLRLEIPLKDGRRVVVLYPPDLTEEEAKKVGIVLSAIAT